MEQEKPGEPRWWQAWMRRTYPVFRGWVVSAFGSGSRRWRELDRSTTARLDPVVERLAMDAGSRWSGRLQRSPGLAKAVARLEQYMRGIFRLGRSALDRLPDRWRPGWPPKKAADWLAAGLAVLVLAMAAPWGPQPLARPRPVRRPLEVIAYFENGIGGMFVPSLPVLRQQRQLIDTVAPFWYSVNWDGTVIHPRHQPEVLAFTRQHGMQIIPLINNVVVPGADNARMIATAETRAATVANLVALVDEHGYHGLNIYFTWLGPKARANYTAFIAELGRELAERGRLLAVSIYPREGSQEQVHGHFDYAALVQHASYLILMAYDHHWEGSEAGPTAPLPWVEANIVSALRDIPADRLVLATGLFGYDWTVPARAGVTQYLPAKDAAARARRLRATVERQYGQPFFRYRLRDLRHEVWFEDTESFAEKLALARRHRLRGIALWRLGFEEPGLWDLIRQQLGQR